MANGEFWRESKNAPPAPPSHPNPEPTTQLQSIGGLSEMLLPVVMTPGVAICQIVYSGGTLLTLRSKKKHFNLFKNLNSFTCEILE